MMFESLESRVLLADTILFIRGATRSGGFLEGTTATSRNEQLADINNTSTANGNAGWGTLAADLRSAGFVVEQMTEPKEPVEDGSGVTQGRPIRFENLDLTKYSAIVFGSNNARYAKASIDAVSNYISNGGSALFISDANFGSNWRDAADSDQQFLAPYGLIVNQDAASGTTTLSRSSDFAAPSHPILTGVNSITGEGVSPVVIPDVAPPGVTITRVLAAKGQTRNNNGTNPANQFQGTLRATNANDAALALLTKGRGRVAAFFDRNTFFNANGVGTDITGANNRSFALNLFRWLADHIPPAPSNITFTQGAPRVLKVTFNDHIEGLTRSDILLRDPFTAEPIPRTRWGWELTTVGDHSELSIRIKGAQPAGLYQFQINANRVTDDAGNPNARIRHNFTIVWHAPISVRV